MDASSGQPGVTDTPRSEVHSLSDDVAPSATESPSAIRAELNAPYTLTRWREDLRALAEGAVTGFDALEANGLRWMPGKLYAVIGRPGGGKTAFLLEAAIRYLIENPRRMALFVSWEEPLSDVVLRLILRSDALLTGPRAGASSFSASPLFRSTVRSWGRGNDSIPLDIAGRLDMATEMLKEPLSRLRLIDGDAIGRDAGSVLREVAAWMRSDEAPKRPDGGTAIGFVAVDYFQKLRSTGHYSSRQLELAAVSDLLRRFSKGSELSGDKDLHSPEYMVPVLVGGQVTRGGDEHPSGDTIREADDLLNDASGVIALSWESHTGGGDDDAMRTMRISVPKNRDGRARPDEIARYEWRPARSWLAPNALRDGAAIKWAKLKQLTTAATSNGTRGVID